ncbi:FIP1[V]-like protein [Lotus japonicus]|uniref:FIP1[V]-like protein n=1 Tax=Lotus japonicus TaxID=34305 RepID=UPI0025829348|nr:FIP1[V]-like protein [Lotus japonicus]
MEEEEAPFHGGDDDDFGQLYLEEPLPQQQQREAEEEEADANSNHANENVAIESSDDDDDDDLNIVLNDDGFDIDDRDASTFVHNPPHLRTQGQGGSLFANNQMKKSNPSSMAMPSSFNNMTSSHLYAAAPNPMVSHQGGYSWFLPSYWSAFNVNVDALKEKPWVFSGVHKTDYFNYGFDETTWKLYCTSLEQHWRTSTQQEQHWRASTQQEQHWRASTQTGISVDGSAKLNKPKGKAIRVEESMGERQPSIHLRRPVSRDSDVVIEIKVLESSDDHSGSGNSTVVDASLEVESIVGKNKNILNYFTECDDVLSEDQLEDVKKSDEISLQQERTSLIPGVNEDGHQDQADHLAEDTAEVSGKEIKAEENGGMDACSPYSCWNEPELSLGDHEHSLTSYTDSDSEGTQNSVHVDDEKSLVPERRQSINSITDLKGKSLPLYCENSKNNSFSRKAVNVAYNSRTRVPHRKEWRHRSGRHEGGLNLNKHNENDNHVSSILMSGARDLSQLGSQFVDYGSRHREQLQGFGSHKRRDVSYTRETKQTCYYGGEKAVDDLVQRDHSKYSYEEGRVRDKTNRYYRKNWGVRNYFSKPGSRMARYEDRERDHYHDGWGYAADDLNPDSCRESMLLLPKHSSFPHQERDTQRERINDKSYFRDRNYNDDFDECEIEFSNKSYRMSPYSAEIEMEYLNNKRDEQFLHTDRDWRGSVRRVKHRGEPPLVLDNLWSGKMDEKCQAYTHHQNSNFRYRRQSTHSVRNVCGARVKENFEYHTHAAEDEDFMLYPVEEYQCYRSSSKFQNCTEEELVFRHHETHATSLQDDMQIDDIKLRQHQLNMPRRNNNGFKSSKVICRSNLRQAALRCRKSVDLVNGEGKSQARSSGIFCSGRLQFVDEGIAKKPRASVGLAESRKKAITFETSKYESNLENKKCLQNLQDKGQKESLDIEEGQVVPEELFTVSSVSRKDVSEGAAKSQHENNSDQFIGGYDNQRILDSLAKMEKRGERFKQPITLKTEAEEEGLKLNNDSVDAGEAKQHRPARKRRWVGS